MVWSVLILQGFMLAFAAGNEDGPPESPHGCAVVNQTSHTLTIECQPGYNGGLQQVFHMEVYDSILERMVDNVTSTDRPRFTATGLNPKTRFVLVIYSSNNKGRSNSQPLAAATLAAAKKQTVISEMGLRRELFACYDKLARPVHNFKDAVPVYAGLQPIIIRELDEKKQLLIMDGWMFLKWSDDYLKWDPEFYDGLKVLNVAPTEIWRPDLAVYTAPSDSLFPTTMTNAVVFNNGTVLWVPPVTIKSWCPFKKDSDIVKCNIKIGSWTFGSDRLNPYHEAPQAERDFIDNNPDWKMQGMAISRESKYYPCCVEDYPVLHFNVTLKRRHPVSEGIFQNLFLS